MKLYVMECHLCGYERSSDDDGRMFHPACACLTPDCDGESGDECGEVLLCDECL